MHVSSTNPREWKAPQDTRAQYGTSNVIPLRSEDAPPGRRLNLLVPFTSQRWAFAGITTAVRLFEAFAPHFDCARIIVTNETSSDFEADRWPAWSPEPSDLIVHSIRFLGDRTSSLSLSSRDFFIATEPDNAHFCHYLISLQRDLFPGARRELVYFIQEYEPGFAPWSVPYAQAEASYKDTGDVIAIYSTKQLADFFRDQRLDISKAYIYEPLLHPFLRKRRTRNRVKERLILIYARPSIVRNGFSTIVDALRIWAQYFPDAHKWTVISDGDPHPDIEIGAGVTLMSRGRARLEDYADYLSRCWIGLAIVCSAHPGCTVLDMADFGAWVITNKWRNKDPSLVSPNILSVDVPWPEAIAERLAWCCAHYQPNQSTVLPDLPNFRRNEEEEFPFLKDCLTHWMSEWCPAEYSYRIEDGRCSTDD